MCTSFLLAMGDTPGMILSKVTYTDNVENIIHLDNGLSEHLCNTGKVIFRIADGLDLYV